MLSLHQLIFLQHPHTYKVNIFKHGYTNIIYTRTHAGIETEFLIFKNLIY